MKAAQRPESRLQRGNGTPGHHWRATAGAVALLVSLSVGVVFALPIHEGISDAKTFEAKGVQDDQLYFQAGGATINAFNFNLVLGVDQSIGFPMTVDGGLTIGLQPIYNVNFYTRQCDVLLPCQL
jgi:hypothetical protein